MLPCFANIIYILYIGIFIYRIIIYWTLKSRARPRNREQFIWKFWFKLKITSYYLRPFATTERLKEMERTEKKKKTTTTKLKKLGKTGKNCAKVKDCSIFFLFFGNWQWLGYAAMGYGLWALFTAFYFYFFKLLWTQYKNEIFFHSFLWKWKIFNFYLLLLSISILEINVMNTVYETY